MGNIFILFARCTASRRMVSGTGAQTGNSFSRMCVGVRERPKSRADTANKTKNIFFTSRGKHQFHGGPASGWEIWKKLLIYRGFRYNIFGDEKGIPPINKGGEEWNARK